MSTAASRLLHRRRSTSSVHVVLADFSEARIGPRNGEPIANGARNSAYDLSVAGPRIV